MKTSGVNLHVWVSKAELVNAKNGGTTMRASKAKTKDADLEVTVSLDACDILDDEVRVNLALAQQNFDELGKQMGAAMGAELEKVFKAYE